MNMRRWLARKLDPDTARNAERYWWLHMEIADAHRWLGEFGDADAVLEWLLMRNADHWRALGEPATNRYPSDISGFREHLRGLTREYVVRNQPRGLSAAEAPTSAEGVNPTPTKPMGRGG